MPPSLTIPKIIGNRGARAYAPENTLAAIHAAADLGVEWIELDVKITKDGEAILFHDDHLDRCTNASGPVAETTLKDIQELDAGSWYAESFMGEKVPTLEDALNLALDLGLGVNINIKPCPGREVETTEAALDIATRIWPDDLPSPLISSPSHVSLETAMNMIPEWPRGFVMEEQLPNWRDFVDHLDVATIHVDGYQVTEDLLEEYMDAQKMILAYNIDQPDKARELRRWGVDGFIADNPDSIREAIEMTH